MLRSSLFASWLAVLLLAAPAWSAEDPAKKSALDLLPPSTVAYVEMPAPGKLLDTILDHPLTHQLEQHPDYQRALESPDVQQLREVVKLFEGKLGTEWRPALRSLTADGVYLGVELGTQGVVVLVRSSDPALLVKTRDTFIELARKDAADKGKEDPIKSEDYHGVTAYKLNDVYYATLGPWLILTNKARVGQMIIDNALDEGRQSLGNERQFQEAVKQKVGTPTVWAYVDLTILRVSGVAKNLLNKKSDNPAGELLIGGVLAAAPDAPFVTASLTVDKERIALSTAIPFDAKKAAKAREYYFGPNGTGAAPALLNPKDTIVSFSTYRDFGLMWKQAPDLFDDNANAKFAEAENTLTTLFSGRSFPDDILANLEPGVQWVVTRQSFGKDDVTPQLKLPATALVFRMKKPAETARQFKITYQSLVGFLNIAGGMNKLEALEQDTEKIGGVTVVSASYIPPEKAEDRAAAGIHFNASPTVAFVGDRFILSSTKGLAIELGQMLEKNPPKPDEGVNTQLQISADALRATLADNRPQLVAQNKEEKGHSEADAEREIDLLMKLLAGLKSTSFSLTTKNDSLRASWELQLAK
jgi:hypothetical protein